MNNKSVKTGLIRVFLLVCVVCFLDACINQINKSNTTKSKHVIPEEVEQDQQVDLKLFVGAWEDSSEAALHFSLFEDGTARSDNMKTLLYKKWRVEKDKIVFTVESIGNGTSFFAEDTCVIESITKNEMILKKGEFRIEYKRRL